MNDLNTKAPNLTASNDVNDSTRSVGTKLPLKQAPVTVSRPMVASNDSDLKLQLGQPDSYSSPLGM